MPSPSVPHDLTTLMAARLARRDVPRDVPRVSVSVVSTSDGLCYGGHVISVGENVIEIYEDELEGLEAMVEDDEIGLRLAEEDFQAHVAEVKEKGETARTYLPSLSASFRHLRRRDLRPLKSVELVEGGGTRKGRKRDQQAA